MQKEGKMTNKKIQQLSNDGKELKHSELPKKPTSVPKSLLVNDIRGSLDKCDAIGIDGWAFNKIKQGDPLEIEILADGQLIGRVMADKYREDLLAAGFGNGNHSFKIDPPPGLFDGNEHLIEAREVSTGFLLPNSPKVFKAVLDKSDDIRLDGGTLIGSILLPEGIASSLYLEVIEGVTVIGGGWCTPDSEIHNKAHFRLPLPTSVFDGRPHAFSVRSNDPAMSIGDLATITPYMLTPDSALLRYAREGLKPSITTMAGFRYESLINTIIQLGDGKTSSVAGSSLGVRSKKTGETEEERGAPLTEKLSQIAHAHAQLVRGFSEKDKVFKPLTFVTTENPCVSIVIPVHNKFPVTYHCLLSLLLAPNRISFEVIIVDDGSIDESTRIPELIKGVQYVRNDETVDFVRACNLGGSLARGEYIVMLNNDTEVTSGWLDELLWPFEHFDNVGVTGAKLLYPDGSLQEAGGIVWNTGDPWIYGRGANAHDPRYNYARQVDYLSGACIMLPAQLWNEVGGFSDTFAPAYFEDTDLTFKVRDKGCKTIYTPFAQVIHFEGISSGTSISSGMKRFQEINRLKFKSRWASYCRDNGRVGVDVELNKDRNIELRALVLDAETPMPDQNAGSYAAIQEMRMLQKLGFKCTFVPHNMAWMGRYTEDLQRMGVECIYAPFASSINEVIEKRGGEFNLVYITRYYVAKHFIDVIRQYAPQAKIVMNNADLHFLRELRAAVEAKNSEALSRSVQTRDEELATMRQVDLTLTYTDVEKAVILSHNLDSARVAKCPWVVEVASEVPGFDARTDIAFLGGYNHHPNIEAVEWFADKVMPLLRKSLPDVKMRIYGSNVPKSLITLAEKVENLVIEGWVPTLDQIYNTCRIFIAPLRSGAGIKGKVIGALAYGVPSILSPIAAEGILFSNGIDACIADKPEEWVAAITKLYGNSENWASMSQQALRFAQNHYGFAKGVTQMQEALGEVEIFTTIKNRALAAH